MAGPRYPSLYQVNTRVRLGELSRALGRPATLLALNPDGGRYVGLDFEARNLMATAVDFSQQPLRQAHKTVRAADSVEQIRSCTRCGSGFALALIRLPEFRPRP